MTNIPKGQQGQKITVEPSVDDSIRKAGELGRRMQTELRKTQSTKPNIAKVEKFK